MGSVLRDPALVRIEIAYLIFNMTEYATWIAILVYAYSRGGAAAAGAIALIQLVPAAMVAPIAAFAGDRFRRDRVLVVDYLVQAVALGLAATVLLADAPFGLVAGAAMLAAVSLTFTRPAQAALLPAVTQTPEDLTAANVVSGIAEGLGIMLGPLIAGLLMRTGQPGAVFATFAGLSLVGGILVARLPVDVAAVTPATPIAAREIRRETLAGFTAIARERDVRTIVLLLASGVVVIGALDVLFVATAIDLLHLGESGVGYLNAAFGAGGILGAAAAVVLVGRRRLTPPLATGAAVLGAPVSLISAAPSAVTAPVLFGIGGAGRSAADIAGRTLLQRTAPDHVLTRVFGVLEGLGMVALAIGSVAASALVETLGIRLGLLITGAFVPAMLVLLGRRLLAIDRDAEAPDPEMLELFRGLRIFAPLPAASLERVIRHLEPVTVAAGETFIREGEAGDRFYVIVDGTADVSAGRTRIATLSAGDFVGEVALLRDTPRTATVTAATPLRLLALAREPFLEAVTGHPQSRRAADDVIAQRLEKTAERR